MMKVLILSNGLVHYYNLVLNRLNGMEGHDLIVVVPAGKSGDIGDGVHLSSDGVTFKVCELGEYTWFRIFTSFKGLLSLLLKEKPDIIVVYPTYILNFVLNLPVMLITKFLRIKIIMKSIPFMVPSYDEEMKYIWSNPRQFNSLPPIVNSVLKVLGILQIIRWMLIQLTRLSFNAPHAHVAYVDDAYRVFGSYGVLREKIFITRNSPDTDVLFSIKKLLAKGSPILISNSHRLIHVGRLVEWKMVDMLIRAFSRLKGQFSDAELLIIGGGPKEAELKALAAELGLGNEVKFLGPIHDYKLLGQYLLTSSVYVLAGMGGLSINDAMAFDLPIICSVCDGTEKVLVRDGYNGFYFRKDDESDLLKKLTAVISDADRAREMGLNSRKIIENEVNIHTVLKVYVQAFQYVLEQHNNEWRL